MQYFKLLFEYVLNDRMSAVSCKHDHCIAIKLNYLEILLILKSFDYEPHTCTSKFNLSVETRKVQIRLKMYEHFYYCCRFI